MRTKYEKFLLTNGITAPDYEKNIFNLESKGQLLSFIVEVLNFQILSLKIYLIKENKSKEISVIDLQEVYSKKN